MTPNEREDLRIKMVALLYGELPEDQVESVRSAIESDPELSVEFAQWNAVRGAIAENIDNEAPAARVRESLMAAAREAVERRDAVAIPAEKETPRWLRWLEQLGTAPAFAGFGIVVLAAGLLYTVTQEYSDEGLVAPTMRTGESPRVEKGALETGRIVAPVQQPKEAEEAVAAEEEPARKIDPLLGNLNEGAFNDKMTGTVSGASSDQPKSQVSKNGAPGQKQVAFGSGGLGSRGTGAGGGGVARKKAARKRGKSTAKRTVSGHTQLKKKEMGTPKGRAKQKTAQRQARSAPAFAPPPPAPESAVGAPDSVKETQTMRRDSAPSKGVLHGADADSLDEANQAPRPAPSRRAQPRPPSREPQPSAAPAPAAAPSSSTRVEFAEANVKKETLEDEGPVAEEAPEADLEPASEPEPEIAHKSRSGHSTGRRAARSRVAVGAVEGSGSCDAPEARGWLRQLLPGIRQCHRAQLASKPDTAGPIGLSWRVENDGRPKAVKVDQTDLRSGSADLSSCLAKVIRNAGPGLFGTRQGACLVRSTLVLRVIGNTRGPEPSARPVRDVGEAEGRGL